MKVVLAQKFLDEVMSELIHVRDNATKEEIGKLIFSQLDTTSATKCIYGQMTGDCSSKRAKELSPKTFYDLRYGYIPYKGEILPKYYDRGNSFTALEKYIVTASKTKNREIFQFLRGKLKEITL